MGENRTKHNTNKPRHDVCFELPPEVNSYGFWTNNNPNPDDLLRNSLSELELQMLMVFCISHSFHFVLKRLGLPRLTSEIIETFSYPSPYISFDIICFSLIKMLQNVLKLMTVVKIKI